MRKLLLVLLLAIFAKGLCGPNQTDDLSPILAPDSLPYQISIVLSDFQLPSDNLNSVGIQAFCYATYKGKWLLLAGRTNGLHGFSNVGNNFPPALQNPIVYVVDPNSKS